MQKPPISDSIPTHFSPASRIWIYQSSRAFTEDESAQIQEKVTQFIQAWTAHGASVKGLGLVLLNRFIVLVADETHTQVSGCSTDSSVHFIQQVQQEWGTDFFNRRALAFWVEEDIVVMDMVQLPNAIEQQSIHAATPYFNNLVTTLQEWRNDWMQPAGKSWIAQKYPDLLSVRTL
jgi:hypothetical protein